jgi:hypothetical protein
MVSDAGLRLYHELDHAVGRTEIAEERLRDERNGRDTRHGLGSQLSQIFSPRCIIEASYGNEDALTV